MYQAVENITGYHSVFMHSQPSGLLWTLSQHLMLLPDWKSGGGGRVQAEQSEDFSVGRRQQ